ncbi:PEP-CTERM sorting domain-containing protein [bacterium]|nr:PEP-CTERM sorting domain-containing protein [bacterium]
MRCGSVFLHSLLFVLAASLEVSAQSSGPVSQPAPNYAPGPAVQAPEPNSVSLLLFGGAFFLGLRRRCNRHRCRVRCGHAGRGRQQEGEQ